MIKEILLPDAEKDDYWIWRVLFWIGLFCYSFRFLTLDINPEVMNSFMHGPNLIFHEAGHVIFMPFSRISHNSRGFSRTVSHADYCHLCISLS